MPESSSSGSQPAPVGHKSSAPPIAVAQHFNNYALAKIWIQQQQQSQQKQNQQSSSAASSRKQPGGPVDRLPTLPEASHVNALNEATGPSPLGLPHGLDNAADAALSSLSAPQRALAQAKGAGYTSAVMELANEEFRQRWEALCLAEPDGLAAFGMQSSNISSSNQYQPTSPALVPPGWNTSAHPGGMGGSWELVSASATIPPEAGGRPLPRSSSRNALLPPKGLTPREAAQARALFEAQRIRLQQARDAEEWRKNPIFRRTELNLTKLEDSEGVVAMAPNWLELDSPDEGIRLDSEIALHALLTYASYLAISTFILPPPSSDPTRRNLLPHYARAINAALTAGPGGEGAPSAGSWMNLAVRLPISSPHSLAQILASRPAGSAQQASANPGASNFRATDDWAYDAWVQVRHLCGYNTRLHVLLDLSMPLPSSSGLARWVAEPVTHIWLPAGSFLANAKGFPVLSKAMQTFLRSLFAKIPRPTVVLSGVDDPPAQHTRGGPTAYLEYLRHLERTTAPEGAVQVFARGYADWLQAPLQPLMDNLEGSTYEVFERDPIKYALYQEAVNQALQARPASEITTIWVCGAGRGPLVSRCLAAASDAGRAVKIVALEKNPSAMITLQEKQVKEWGADRVELRFGDMRTAERPAREEDRADILVSELLGSFGDNELSPECLDGACRFLKRTGISIPSSYASYVTPLSSAKLHNEILASGSNTAASSAGPSTTGSNPSASNAAQVKAAETPFVVLFGAVDLPAADMPTKPKIQECWTFAHGPAEDSELPLDGTGLPISNSHNVRTSSHSFQLPNAALCHGLAGFFEAHLYGDVTVSIHPDPARGSKDMLSWFPIYFPLKEPLYIPAGAEVDVHLWRLSSGRKVWYEWSLESFLTLPGTVGGTGRPSSAMSNVYPAHSPDAHGSPALGANATLDPAHPAAFANAPNTPRMPSVPFPGDGGPTQRQASNSSAASAATAATAASSATANGSMMGNGAGRGGVSAAAGAAPQRIKIGMSSLQNPNGRSSWVGM